MTQPLTGISSSPSPTYSQFRREDSDIEIGSILNQQVSEKVTRIHTWLQQCLVFAGRGNQETFSQLNQLANSCPDVENEELWNIVVRMRASAVSSSYDPNILQSVSQAISKIFPGEQVRTPNFSGPSPSSRGSRSDSPPTGIEV